MPIRRTDLTTAASASSLTYSSLRRQARGKVETLVMRRRQSSTTNFSWHSSVVVDTKQKQLSAWKEEINRFGRKLYRAERERRKSWGRYFRSCHPSAERRRRGDDGQEDGQTREIIEESLLHLLLLLLPCGNKKCFPHHVAIKSSQEAEEGTEDLTCSFSPSSLCPTIAMAACLLLDKEGYNFKRQKQGENTLASGEFRLAFFFKKGTTHGNGFLWVQVIHAL